MEEFTLRKTKIICTLGPAVDDPEVLERLFLKGMDAARLNFSHGDHEEQRKRVIILKIRESWVYPFLLWYQRPKSKSAGLRRSGNSDGMPLYWLKKIYWEMIQGYRFHIRSYTRMCKGSRIPDQWRTDWTGSGTNYKPGHSLYHQNGES